MPDTVEPTVWIANRAGHDYSKAERYGKLESLTVGNKMNPTRTDRLAYTLARAIGGFVKSKDDFLLVSGSPPINQMAFYLWMSRFGECRLLIWDAKARDYVLNTVTSDQLDDLLEKAILGVL